MAMAEEPYGKLMANMLHERGIAHKSWVVPTNDPFLAIDSVDAHIKRTSIGEGESKSGDNTSQP